MDKQIKDLELREGYTLEDLFSLTTLKGCAYMLEAFGGRLEKMQDSGRQEAMDYFQARLESASYLPALVTEKPGRFAICPAKVASITYLYLTLPETATLSPDNLIKEYAAELLDELGSVGGFYEDRVALFQEFAAFLDEEYNYNRLVLHNRRGLAVFLPDIKLGASDEPIYYGDDLCFPFFPKKLIPYVNDHPYAPVTGYARMMAKVLVERVCDQAEDGVILPGKVYDLIKSNPQYIRSRDPIDQMVDAVGIGFRHEMPFKWEGLEFNIRDNPGLYQWGSDVLAALLKAARWP